jgi:ABC-type Zn uptake system ZnuABC Zn-binding protein ZnuA
MCHRASALAGALMLLGLAVDADGAHKLRVVTTIPDFKALVEEIGGDQVDVESLARGSQNAHDVEIRPSLVLRLRRADLFVENGLGLDAWSDIAVQGANNPKIIRGAPRFGLVQAGTIEDRPGIPPSPQHLAQLIRRMKDELIKIVLVQPWNDVKLAQRVAEEAGAKVIIVPTMVGGAKGIDTYIGTIDYNVKVLAQALH